jgi:hypothetical protein
MMFQPKPREVGQGCDRNSRQFQMLTILYDERWVARTVDTLDGWVTTTSLAKALNLKPTTHLRGILTELFVEGVIEHRQGKARTNGVYRAEWRIAKGGRYIGKWKECFDVWLSTSDPKEAAEPVGDRF